jgi:hypothetical protein
MLQAMSYERSQPDYEPNYTLYEGGGIIILPFMLQIHMFYEISFSAMLFHNHIICLDVLR